jgi:ABC-type Co2+ transport system permease subunit
MHIHIPDGVFPPWLWISGILIIIPLIILAIYFTKKDNKKLVLASAITALMLIVFSIEVFGYHLNFTALSGMILGAWWSLLSITIVNIFLALFGHGGVTVAPINILINWVEALIAFFIFRFVLSKIKNFRLKSSISGITVFFSLFISFILFIGIIALAGINPSLQIEHEHESREDINEVHGEEESNEIKEVIPLNAFVLISIIPMLISALIESVLTSFIVIFISKVKPRLLI